MQSVITNLIATHTKERNEMRVITFKPDQLKNLDMTKEVTLVGDHGVYLMNLGDPSSVCYAYGINPSVDDDWWGKKSSTYGGDDGTDHLGVLSRYHQESDLRVTLSDTQIILQQRPLAA